jgi:hypothetical protein
VKPVRMPVSIGSAASISIGADTLALAWEDCGCPWLAFIAASARVSEDTLALGKYQVKLTQNSHSWTEDGLTKSDKRELMHEAFAVAKRDQSLDGVPTSFFSRPAVIFSSGRNHHLKGNSYGYQENSDKNCA